MSGNRFAAAASTRPHAGRAVEEVVAAIRRGLGEGVRPTLMAVFVSPDLLNPVGDGPSALIHDALSPDYLIGCTAEAVIADGREIEQPPAISAWAAFLPEASITSFHVTAHRVEEGIGIDGWPPDLDADPPPAGPMIVLSDPFSFPTDLMLNEINRRKAPTVVGGLASGGMQAGDHRLFFGREELEAGAVGVLLSGVETVTAVSQGCAPIGPEMTVTDADGPVVSELAGRPAREKLNEVIAELDEEERQLADEGILAGIVVDENRADYGTGDFLVRALRAGESEDGTIMIGERMRIGQVVQLQVRDEQTARDELRDRLADIREGLAGGDIAGGLMFTCNGRGSQLFGEPGHDAEAVGSAFGDPAVAGFFANGEIGPVGGASHLHGYTASMLLFTDSGETKSG